MRSGEYDILGRQAGDGQLVEATDRAIAEENAAVIEEERTGRPVSTPSRRMLAEILEGMR